MARFVKNEIQTVQVNMPVVFDHSQWAKRKYIFHTDGSGIVTLRGIVNNPNADYAIFRVDFNGNIAVPAGQTAQQIGVALARNGEPIATSRALVTPTALGAYFNVAVSEFVVVPKCGTVDISIVNVTEGNIPISVQNAGMTVTRIA